MSTNFLFLGYGPWPASGRMTCRFTYRSVQETLLLMIEVPVLIVGGGPVGLTASLMLSRLGIKSLLVERHPGTAIHPKARGINARTMEVFHQQGIEADVREAGLPPEQGRASSSGPNARRRGDRAARAVGPERAAGRGDAGARLPVRPGLSRAGAAALRRAAAAGRAALQHRAHDVRAGRVAACRDDHEHGDGRHREGAGAVHDRRRRRAKPRAQRARHRHARREGRL